METYEPTKKDFTLMEWILACQCCYINRAAGFKHLVARVQRMLSMVFESMDPMITRMTEAEEALGKCRLQTAFPCCTVKALSKTISRSFCSIHVMG
jgi:hypothetical protein